MKHDFNEQAVLITGAASGIGQATAIAFAAAGAKVALSDVDQDGLERTREAIISQRGQCFVNVCDVTDESSVKRLVTETVENFGQLDIAFNNAGVGGEMSKTADQTKDAWQRVIDINLTGVWLCMKHELQAMLAGHGGSIINTASVAGLVGMHSAPAYCAAKHGVVGLTKNAALEYAKSNIRINAVCPGGVRTNMTEQAEEMYPGFLSKLAKHEPMGRLAEPSEIADAVLWLASSGATFMTGHALAVDGGFVAR
ncbi:MAG: SDR family oxidoreductase [Gammaproteobacteria bacterium]